MHERHSASEFDQKSMMQFRAAAVQAEPEWLNLGASIKKTCRLITDASQAGAQIIAFPELWIPGYPGWIW